VVITYRVTSQPTKRWWCIVRWGDGTYGRERPVDKTVRGDRGIFTCRLAHEFAGAGGQAAGTGDTRVGGTYDHINIYARNDDGNWATRNEVWTNEDKTYWSAIARVCHNRAVPNGGTIAGTRYPDLLCGGPEQDTIDGEGGPDVILGGRRADTLRGGPGRDQIWGQAGADQAHGGDHSDAVQGGAGNDRLEGGPGDDVVMGGTGRDTIIGGAGGDSLYGFLLVSPTESEGSPNHVSGGLGDDRIVGSAGADLLEGRGGHDTLQTRGGADRAYGHSGDDVIQARDLAFTQVFGGLGHDCAILDAGDTHAGVEVTSGAC
jgi:Ca2+-binding RTX toxin-like protein